MLVIVFVFRVGITRVIEFGYFKFSVLCFLMAILTVFFVRETSYKNQLKINKIPRL